MPDSGPICLSEVLAEEYKALRSDTSYAPSGAAAPESARLAELFQKVHQQPQPFSALCISGGGIRSATFGLGALQGLAEQGLLERFDFLSTVSGGGYIGSWLTAWIQRAGGLANVAPHLKRDAHKPPPGEPDPIQHLRDFNNYLTPKMGFFSTDTWTVVATITRNMVLNWLVFVPLLLFALTIPRILVSLVTIRNFLGPIAPESWALVSQAVLVLSYILCALAIFNAVRYLPGIGNVRHTQNHFLLWVLAPLVLSQALQCAHFHWWWVDTQDSLPNLWFEVRQGLIESYAGWLAYLLMVGMRMPRLAVRMLFGPLTFAMFLLGSGIGICSWLLFSKVYPAGAISLSHFIALGPPLLLVGFSLAGGLFIGLTSRVLKDEDREWMSRAGAWLSLVILFWAGICSLVLLLPEYAFGWRTWVQSAAGALAALSGWTSARAGYSGKSKAIASERESKTTSWQISLALKLAPPVFVVLYLVGLACVTNLAFTLTGLVNERWWNHGPIVESTPLFANVLVSAVCLGIALIMARYININLFSIHAMYRNRLIRAYLGASNPKRNVSPFTGFAQNDNLEMWTLNTARKPLQLLNLTLNLVAGERLAWQQRKAESFTVTALHSGSSNLGYRPSSEYASGITLGTAMAISGAAASPNMGYHSSPVVGFIMTLFNARLGAWLGNPGPHGENTWRQRGPRSATRSLISEAFGLTNDTSDYVYLSDGGHYENLGLYEMVRRRCRHIVVLDSGADPEFTYEDLGNALRKIRIDMNIPIEFDGTLPSPSQRQTRCAVARICYSAVDGPCPDGHLIYVKPIFLGNEAPDVQSYHTAHGTFPHEATGDQWFDESQTESYRMLGLQSISEIARHLKEPTLDGLRESAQQYLQSQGELSLTARA